ncbi:hypothetical protein GOODEAATRI_025683, partial [Goodea atripinnis]
EKFLESVEGNQNYPLLLLTLLEKSQDNVIREFIIASVSLFQATIELCQTHGNDINALKVLFSSLTLISKLFYSLNFQDEEEAGLLELLKSQICDNAALYAQKYDEEFQPYLPRFVTAIWNLLVSTGQEVKYDLLVSNAIQFLASVCERPHYKHLFEDHNTLTSICEKVIVPNMEFRTIFSGYVNSMLAEYAKNPGQNWKHKDAAIYLVTSLASKAQTQKVNTRLNDQHDSTVHTVTPVLHLVSIVTNCCKTLESQVMSLLLEIHSSSIPASYMALFPHLLQPALWERTGNIPPLVRLLQAYLEKGGASIAASAADKIVSKSNFL